MSIPLLDLFTAFRKPSFAILQEGINSSPEPLMKIRLMVWRWLGGRVDAQFPEYKGMSALSAAAEKGNAVFLKAAIPYSSAEHVDQVHAVACTKGWSASLVVFAEFRAAKRCRDGALVFDNAPSLEKSH